MKLKETLTMQLDQQILEEVNSLTTKSSVDTVSLDRSDSCFECSSENIRVYNGNYVCFDCYAQQSAVVSDTAEWKQWNENGSADNSRCSLYVNPILPEYSCNTSLRTNDYAYAQKFRQISKWQIPHSEKSLKQRLDDVRYYCKLCNLPGNITEFAQQLYAEFIVLQPLHQKKKSSRGDCHLGIIAVCISYACKDFELARPPEDICSTMSIDMVDYTKANNLFFSVMQFSDIINIAENSYIIKSSDYIDSFCLSLGITDSKTRHQIMTVEKKIAQLKILQKNTPQAIAAGCIYFVAKMKNIPFNKSDFDTCCKISVPTLTKVYDQLTEYTDELITCV